MLRRIVSLGGSHEFDSPREHMSPSPGDVPPSPDSSRAGGLASVFKGLTGSSKLTKSPPPQPTTTQLPIQSPAASSSAPPPPPPQTSELVNAATPSRPVGLSPSHMESFEQLRHGAPNERVAAANSLRLAITQYPLSPVLEIWDAAKDMIEPAKPSLVRTAGWELLTECVKHAASTDLERKEYFQTLSAPASPEDFHLQLAAVVDLTKRGRDLSGFDYDVIPLLTHWLLTAYKAVRSARKARAKGTTSRSRVAALGEEKNFSQLFSFIIDVVKFGSNVADEAAVGELIDNLVFVCLNTSIEEDLRSCIAVLEAIVTFGSIPNEKLKDCVQVLSSIYTLVSALEKVAWHTLGNLCRSHNGQATVRILLDALRSPPADGTKEKEVMREARSALAVLMKLLTKTTEKGYPTVPFVLLVDGLSATATATPSTRVLVSELKLINALFDNGNGEIHHLMRDEDWTTLLEVAVVCSKKATKPSGPPDVASDKASPTKDDYSKAEEAIGWELLRLIARLEDLLTQKSNIFIPRQALISFLAEVYAFLPDPAACIVLDYFQEFRCCSPTDLQWEENVKLVLEAFLSNRGRTTETRLKALQCVADAYEMLYLVIDEVAPDTVPNLVRQILRGVAEETDITVLEAIVTLMVSVAASAPMGLFDQIVDTLRGIVVNDRLRSPISPPPAPSPGTPTTLDQPNTQLAQTPSNVVTKGYVRIFMRTMDTNRAKTLKMASALVNIAKSNLCENDARLTAMKLLFRLRADWANRVFIITDTESEGLAASLYRTKASLSRKQAEDAAQPSRLSRAEYGGGPRASRGVSFGGGGAQPPERGYPVRSSSGAKPPVQKYQQLWCLPDPDALPESVSQSVSTILVSHSDDDMEPMGDVDVDDLKPQVPINMAAWLEAILNVFQQGCDWEVYSFVLVHLPSQLTNHAIFRDATAQIQELRRLMCEQLRANSFSEPPSSSGLRRSDVAICLFHSLTMVLSYHAHFPKPDEDEIVRTFVHGIATWERCAKYCIHALSICCHELPMSTSKSLVQMLQKMAQIITQPHVAMHILEFLACLSRLNNLFVNFREDEYRIVFGICFRYLQYVRDKKHSQRSGSGSEPATIGPGLAMPPVDSAANPTASDELPQYVYALAYHVITFWFLALKLPDRANHVGWIAKNLFADVDGGQAAEEQALITIDFMQRVAYADADESSGDPLFTQERFGEILKKHWIIGNSIVTVEQASSSGWAQITKRQPSGTSTYTIRENLRPPPPHQARSVTDMARDGQVSGNTVLPSHLLVQLMSSIPQTFDVVRPIPLPDDDNVERTIRVFDRSSTVDGHKVGVIYIGEGQTEEAVILQNVSGSSDYVEFLNGLGTLTKLKGATFNTQGLDRVSDSDGQYTFCWRDRVTEMVFHVTTQMPTDLERDPACIGKKAHIGNDFVNIVFNDSGLPFKFDTFPSAFNYVYIVITPESRASFIASREELANEADNARLPFYKVQIMSKPGFPEISPASETKMVSLKALPHFIRLLALNASVFSLVWSKGSGTEHVSSWRNRLKEISRLRERYGPKGAGAIVTNGVTGSASSHNTPTPPPLTPTPFGSSGGGGASLASVGSPAPPDASRPNSSVRDSFNSLRRASVATFFTSTSEQTSHRSSMMSTATTTDTEVLPLNGLDSLVESIDFSKWAGPYKP